MSWLPAPTVPSAGIEISEMNSGCICCSLVGDFGKALKKVYRGEFKIEDSISLAQNEIQNVFSLSKELTSAPEQDTNIGFYGDIIGLCPLCDGNVIRTKYGYGCTNFREKGCKFTISKTICKRTISVANVKMLLATGKTSKIQGFISKKNGKKFICRFWARSVDKDIFNSEKLENPRALQQRRTVDLVTPACSAKVRTVMCTAWEPFS